jgi:hypothetical protein
MTCLTCRHWAPKRVTQEQRDMGKQGYFLCALGPRWRFLAQTHSCEKHEDATAEVIEARRKWAA